MSKLLKKTLAFVTVAMMFLSGTSVFAGEQLSGVDVTTDGPQAAVESEPAADTDVLKGGAVEAEPVEIEGLKGADLTAKTLTYKSTAKPSYSWFYTAGGSSYSGATVEVKTTGILCVDAIAATDNQYGASVIVGTIDGSQITYWGSTGYLSAGTSKTGIGGIAVKKGTYYVGIQSSSAAYVQIRPYVYSSATRSLASGKTMMAPGYRYVLNSDGTYSSKATSCLFKIKPTKSGYIKVTPKEYGVTTSAGYITLLNKNKKTVSDKLWYYQGSSSSKAVFGVKKGVTYYIKATDFAGSYDNAYAYGMKFTTTKATARSNTKKSKAKKLTRKANYISTVMAANGKSGSQWYKFKVTKKRKTVVKVNATNLKSGTVKAIVYCGSKKVGSTTISKGQVNTLTITHSTTYGKANKGTYYVKLTKSKKANGVYKIKYAQ